MPTDGRPAKPRRRRSNDRVPPVTYEQAGSSPTMRAQRATAQDRRVPISAHVVGAPGEESKRHGQRAAQRRNRDTIRLLGTI